MPDTPVWLEKPVDTDFYITDAFNSPRDYSNWPQKKQLHEGLDFKVVDAQGHPVAVLAAQRGVIDKVANYPQGYGNYVRIRHDWSNGHVYVTWYGHMSSISVQQGQFVQAGQTIGVAGSTGNSTGIHLHLTLQDIGHGLSGYVVDDVVDPYPYFRLGEPPPLVNEAAFLADVTVPDGTILPAGQAFTKTWRIRNSGTIAWGSGYRLAFSANEPMGGPADVPLPPLASSEEGLVSVNLVAPTSAGRYRSTWTPRDAQGNAFNDLLYIEIVVSVPVLSDDATYLADLTIPDHTMVTHGQTFLKQWRVRNNGATIWNNSYNLAFFDDEQMSAPAAVPVPYTRPGEEAVVGVTFTAPPTEGEHTSTWRMRNPQGQYFGEPLFTLVKVQAGPTPLERSEMSYVADVTFADGVKVQAGQVMQKVWRVRNTGTTPWGSGYTLAFSSGEPMGAAESVALPASEPLRTIQTAITLTMPDTPGSYRSVWKLRDPQGNSFGPALSVTVKVK
jgi:hypothetical protein